ncbi:MAG: TusE/DsrC/DsvC family sulfur relay protein [Thiobacillus sp.]|nr:TusE/DsrC/DsvC family sulfur relay protein [Thiobacillus sp.]
MGYLLNGEELETGEEEFLLEANFSDEIVPIIAEAEGIKLTEAHWQVVNYLRDKYKEDGQTPNFRNMVAELTDLHDGVDWKKALYELFPNQPARQGCRVSGLPKPYGKGGY